MRDPRDVIVSRHGQDRERYWTSLRIWKQRLPIVRALSGHDRFLLVRYEDLVADPDRVERHILESAAVPRIAAAVSLVSGGRRAVRRGP